MDLFARLSRQGAMIERLSSDSRGCAPGDCFFAWPGEHGDGRDHIAQAIDRRVAAVVWERSGFAWRTDWRVPNEGIERLKDRAGELASAFHARPSESLWVCGVTGTNGKTSCSQWLATLLARAGAPTAVIGTLGNGFPGALAESGHTTPDALEVQRLLAAFRGEGAQAVSMEVSSHGLLQGRVNGVAFRCALFTNLSHDHLDYHGSMEAYAAAKSRLFEVQTLESAVLNLDDVLGVRLAQRLASRAVRTIGYALAPAALVPGSVAQHVVAKDIRFGSQATEVSIDSSWGECEVRLHTLGRYNVANALGVLGCLLAYGLPFSEAAEALEHIPDVPGRMQRLGGDAAPLLVVDYAHTPDAIEKTLQALRPVATARGGRLVIVFGAGGDRDPSKRAIMGEAASRHADRIVLTSDNPRGEDPVAIIEAIRVGVTAPCTIEPDRATAIEAAIASAADADVVLLAGKGHEAYQELAGERRPFSDVECARNVLARRGTR
ncbi:MAG: UDP-N-acetylmuramoyl-L-alanyl-D-glutamate--2,6-diaminopimelate ligase [Betaproteobacteria bacterium RIFCSPLOWO2_02_FULL_66_14]|nr:MAG: UDP-N-acetylmuramoyl-L-alanyl-D-glutamate--2,6-diaminopimelate ligase [Betaproteobacteria bacterium RIFCSPLOWO2_02_FULL_66_14]